MGRNSGLIKIMNLFTNISKIIMYSIFILEGLADPKKPYSLCTAFINTKGMLQIHATAVICIYAKKA